MILTPACNASASHIMQMLPDPLTDGSTGELQWRTSASTIPRNGIRFITNTQDCFNILSHIPATCCRLPHGCV